MDICLIPDSAPFNLEQRAWLNGFLSGWLGLQPQPQPEHAAPPAPAEVHEPEPEPEPWHDPSLPIDERLRLAEGKPLARRLMAAMAQLDCGACGHVCRTYSEAIDAGTETRLTLCSPGGTETAKALKKLVKERSPGNRGIARSHEGQSLPPPRPSPARGEGEGILSIARTSSSLPPCGGGPGWGVPGPDRGPCNPPAPGKGKADAGPLHNGHGHANATTAVGWSRERPYSATVVRSVRLNGPGSEKETRHVELALGADGPSYEVGDSLGVYPENCPDLVDDLIDALGASGDEPVAPASASASGEGGATSLRSALSTACCLSEVTDPLLEALASSSSDPTEAAAARAMLDDGPDAGMDILDALRRFPSASARLEPAAFVAALEAIKPRLYSISSSPRRHAGQVHLTVRRVAYESNGRCRKGVASTMLADRVGPGSPLRVFVQRSHGFRLPDDPDAPIIMIGPGTGIAPFRAFLHERDALGAGGRNWLFFGDQRASHDYLYEQELGDLQRRGVLHRLDTAFSRDQGRKVYVQDRIADRGAEIFAWLEEGAHIYVCGDARRMAADVDRALRELIATHGAKGDESARAYLAALASSGRYRRDVY